MTKLSSTLHAVFISILFNGASANTKQQDRIIMKIKMIICSVLAAGLLIGCASEKDQQAKLEAQAKVSKVDAEKTALTKAPGGTVKDYEIEMENGKLIWSFVFATPDTKDYFTEVNVDALTGDIVNVEKESAKSEAKEKD
jgi:uncharacterized membrane protein YkoI